MPQPSTHTKPDCAHCPLREFCLPVGLQEYDFEQLDTVIRQKRRLRKGEYLFHSNQAFSSLFAVRTGFFKTAVNTPDGRDQVTGFYMSGELIGMDGIYSRRHTCDAVSLEDAEVCELPFDRMEELGQRLPLLHSHFLRMLSRQIVRDQEMLLLLGNMRAEERLAAFLLNLSHRLHLRGFAANDFILRMSREEIGSYLGLKLETVSRTLSNFNQKGWVKVEHKHILILNDDALKNMIAGCGSRNHN